ncbi:DciA family protein [Kitasatospora sp. NBC_00240]|uniref:DciA family protein n=1 Tax=Kitasatospora sp. NBC_00240 TaxID=2903567 RepID=UPI002250A0DC|nr:DciA family protein [Kitasatospora sp. NBC_00240]MCX5216188.1 DciA family protein [Kitasatospora sp. NBC_00240]
MNANEPSGVDLARVALKAAMESARRRAPEPASRRALPSRRPLRRDGRDPVGLGAALAGLVADRAWDVPAAGGSILDQWPTIAPELAPHAAAVGFDARTGQLEIRPSSAYALQIRLITAQLIDKVNAFSGREVVRVIRVLSPGSSQVRADGGRTEVQPVPEAPVRRTGQAPRTPPAGFREALAIARSARRQAGSPDGCVPLVVDCLREPEELFREGQAARDDELRAAKPRRTRR